jgi:hypothetical protein
MGLAQVAVTDRLTDFDRTGMVGTKHGIFPSNYVKMKE